ncbi:MAG: hypothetical protein ACOC41_01780 [Chitinivibrionales bacterium]
MIRKLLCMSTTAAIIFIVTGCGGRDMTNGEIDPSTTLDRDTTVDVDTIIQYDTTIRRDTLITDTTVERELHQETIESEGVDTLSGERNQSPQDMQGDTTQTDTTETDD